MPKKTVTLALSTIALLSSAGIQAEQLEVLGTGEEIRAEILPVAEEQTDETPEQRKARKKKEAEEKKKKPAEGKCGKGTCS